jgi:mono/diheme cytochrome c family protein
MSCSSNTPFEPPTENNLANFTAIQQKIFNTNCALSGCHTGVNPAAGMNLSEGQAYSQLKDIQSVLYPSLKRVDSGKSDQSVLVLILRGTLTPQMPLGGTALSSAEIDSIALWIDSGAPNN